MQIKINENLKDFLNFVTSSESSCRGCHQLWIGDSSGRFGQVFASKSDKFADSFDDFLISQKFNYYITSNSFYADERSTDTLFQLNNIVIDIDNHSDELSQVQYMVDKFIYFLPEFDIVKPSAVVRTGRGVQLWYHTEGDSASLLWLYKLVSDTLCKRFEVFLHDFEIDLSVDYSSSANFSGLFRLPFSFSSAFSCYLELAGLNFVTYSVDEIAERFRVVPKCSAASASESEPDAFRALHFKRMKFIENYVERRNFSVTGQRNTICFLYYNAAVQVLERSSAVCRLRSLADKFLEKYSDSEREAVIRSVDKKIHFLKNETFFDILSLSSAEIDTYTAMSEYKPKIDRDSRNKKIVHLAVDLLTNREIAEKVGCSEKTVKRVLKDFNKTDFLALQVQNLRNSMSLTQTAKKLDISVDTVKRLQKRQVNYKN